MATPTLITVQGTYLKPDGTPEFGTVRLESRTYVRHGASDDVIAPGVIRAVLDVNGDVSLSVPATDDPAWSPVGWTYRVIIQLSESRAEFMAAIPYSTPGALLDLTDLIPSLPSDGELYAPISHTHEGGGGGGEVTSVAGRTGAVVLAKADVGLANVDNTSDASKPVSTATSTALGLKANLAGPTFTGTVSGISKAMVGLGSVDNTADTAKPVSTAQQTALDLKAPLASPTFTGTVSGVTKAMVGLGSADNTADTAKPVSTAQQTALNLKANLASPALTGTPTVPTAAPGTNTTQAASTAYVTAAVAAGGGGGGATTVVKRAIVTSGNITPQNTSGAWALLTGGPTLTIAAAVGDYVALDVMSMLMAKDTATFYELVIIKTGAAVRYGSTGTASPSTEGDSGLYPDTNFRTTGLGMDLVAAAGDVDGGNLTFGFAVKSAGGGTLYAGTFYTLRWKAINYGAVSVS